MLVLSRKINERIMIGENIELEILGIRGGVVRLGIKAPREVSVIRHELRLGQPWTGCRLDAPARGLFGRLRTVCSLISEISPIR